MTRWSLRPKQAVAARLDPARDMALDAAAICFALLLPTAVIALVDTRSLDGAGIWAKPLKFQVSFGLHLLTVVVLLPLMAGDVRRRAITRVPVGLLTVGALLEVLYVTLQAARGRRSHFNLETSLESLLYYGVMGGAAVAIVVATAWLGGLIWRHPASRQRPGLVLGAGLGLVLGSAVTVLVTAPLAAGAIDGPGHWVGGLRSDAHGLPLVGWSTTGGDLRVPHFFATHLMEVLPVAGWIGDRLLPRRARALVWATAALGLVVTAGTLAQAVSGQPFLGIASG
jgi:uncharacterized membrane protein (DUF441 family)